MNSSEKEKVTGVYFLAMLVSLVIPIAGLIIAALYLIEGKAKKGGAMVLISAVGWLCALIFLPHLWY